MTYELNPVVTRLTRFNSEGGALAAVKLAFGPIQVESKLYKRQDGQYFLSYPARHSEARGSWFDLVELHDHNLKNLAQSQAVAEYERLSREQSNGQVAMAHA